jgi:uncharacterized protein DUF4375
MPGWPRTFKEVFEKYDRSEYADWEAFDESLWYVTCDYFESRERSPDQLGLPKPLAMYFAMRAVLDDVTNGGFAQVFMNLPDCVELAADGMEEIGKHEAATLMREAIRRARDIGPRIDDARIGSVQDWSEYFSEDTFDDLDEQLKKVGWWNRRREEHDYAVRHRDVLESLPPASSG